MSQVVSPSVNRRYGRVRVCQVWEVARSTVYYRKDRLARPLARERRGRRLLTDCEVLAAIRRELAASPWVGEGYRKVHAALRRSEVRVARGRVLRLMRQNGLLAPTRVGHAHGPKAHDGTITTSTPDELWGIDATSTLTTEQGNANVFVVVDHCTAECLALVASKRGTRFEAIDALRTGIHAVFGGYEPGIGGGLSMRHDHGSPFVAELFQRELDFLGITSSPAYVREPEGNGCAERFIRTLKEQLLWLRPFADVSELQEALDVFRNRYNHSWRLEKHGYLSPAQRRIDVLTSARQAA
jgi:transposase InsO family protein